MRVLGIETATERGGVALFDGKRIAGRVSLGKGMVHGKQLVVSIRRMLSRAGWRIGQIELVAVDAGPGSYTGVRVGLATAKVLAYACRAEIIGVCSLDAMARAVPLKSGVVCPALDARWNQVYAAVYRRDGKATDCVIPPRAVAPEELRAEIPAGAVMVGGGLKTYGALFPEPEYAWGAERFWHPHADMIARTGFEMFTGGRRDDVMKIVPSYLRLTEAEMKLRRQA
jgi:tRNA threonylcarbamoyladenosine biosynthesis protein TsaB